MSQWHKVLWRRQDDLSMTSAPGGDERKELSSPAGRLGAGGGQGMSSASLSVRGAADRCPPHPPPHHHQRPAGCPRPVQNDVRAGVPVLGRDRGRAERQSFVLH